MNGSADIKRLLQTALQGLTDNPTKQSLFTDDSFFREALSDLMAWQNDVSLEQVAQHALVLFKPEAVAGGMVAPALEYFRGHGFALVASQKIDMSGPLIHGLWRYQIRRNSIDKIRLYTRWISQVPAVVVAFRDMAGSGAPASVSLSAIKGPALLHKRKPTDLRSVLGSPNSILNYVHSADDPADVVRELAILVPAAQRYAFVQRMENAEIDPGIEHALLRALPAPPYPDLSPRNAGMRIAAAARRQNGSGAESLVRKIQDVSAGKAVLDLYAFEQDCIRLGLDINPIDMFAFGSEFIERNIQGALGDLEKPVEVAARND